jgi:DNA-binding beta-propeller fold protein YncE
VIQRAHIRAALVSATVLACAVASSSFAPIAAAAAGFGEIKGPGGCLHESGLPASAECGAGTGLAHPSAVAVSPDGTSVYVVGGVTRFNLAESFGSITILKRNPATGEVSDSGCLSSDGTDGRDGASGLCTASPSLLGADGVTVGADNRTVFVAAHESASITAFSRDPASGSLTRLGCLQASPHLGSPCTGANLFNGSSDLITSAPGSALYVASAIEGTVSAVTPLAPAHPTEASPGLGSLFTSAPRPYLANPCIAVNGFDGTCSVGVAMKGVGGLTLSPDGKQLYAVARESHAIDVFAPAGTEPLAETSCLKVAAPAGLCGSSALLVDPTQLAISPDGGNLYVADSSSGFGRIDVLSRDATSGRLKDGGCIDYLPEPVKPEPKEEESEPEPTPPPEPTPADPCQKVPGLLGAQTLAVSGDGSAVYAFGGGSAVSFARNASTGALTETACASASDTRCATISDLSSIEAAAVSPDGHNVYLLTGGAKTLLSFGVGASVTGASASASAAGLAFVSVACPAQLPRACHGRVTLTRRARAHHSRHHRGKHARRAARIAAGNSAVFTIRPGRSGRIAVPLDPSARGLLLRARRLRVTAAVSAFPRAGGSGFGHGLVLQLARR